MKTAFKYLKINVFLIAIVSMLFYSCEEEIKLNPTADWPQFKKDNYRSGNGGSTLDLATLGEDWVYTAPQLPVPAWYGPAKEDTFINSGPLPSMRDYDLSYYPIIVDDKLYYGSTSDHAIHCLDATTGKELWTFTTEGPIHIAPTFHNNKLYFGSDDGYAYCINAANGKLEWKFTPSNNKRKLLNNNSLISFWPIRTGVLIENDIAYFGASLLPWKDSYFCAINAKTGKPKGEGTYVKTYQDITLEGAMASTGTKIVQPQGRLSPIIINKRNGEIKNRNEIDGTGGCFVLITQEKNVVRLSQSRTKGITEETIGNLEERITKKKNAQLMSFKGGKEMVVKGDMSYILTDRSISAYNRKTKKVLWAKRNYNAHRIIESGDVLYVGATDAVYAVSTKNGYPLWKASVKGTVYALSIADNALFVSTGEGYIYAFTSGKGENTLLAENTNKLPVFEKEEKQKTDSIVGDLKFLAGPFIKPLSLTRIEISFTTKEATKCAVNWGNVDKKNKIEEKAATKSHKIVVDNLRKGFNYQYQITQGKKQTAYYEYDNFLNFLPEEKLTANKESKGNDMFSLLELSYNGIAIVFGVNQKDEAINITETTGMKVMLFDTSQPKVQQLSEELQKTGIYGGKITVHYVKDLSKLPITSDVANAVIVNSTEVSADEVIRLIKPKGYAILNKNNTDYTNWLNQAVNIWQVNQIDKKGFKLLEKAPFESAGKWTHQYGLANNTAYGGESLWGSNATEDFEIQWMGRPGPRFQTDRSGRKPSPLSVNGKLFVQGRERIVAVDAYNGSVYWSKDIPGLSRMNLIHDTSNWVADDDFVYVAHHQNLLKINSKTGDFDAIIPIEKENSDWGYISVTDDKIIGSSIKKGSTYTNFYGEEGWYDAREGELTHQVVSKSLFAKSLDGKQQVWEYNKASSYIINTTISISNNQMYFVESRNPNFKLSNDGRANPDIFKNTYLVVLDVNTGELKWEKPLNTEAGISSYFMAVTKDYCVIVSSSNGKFDVYNFSALDGHKIWEVQEPWERSHHGGHLSKPAIAKDKLIVRPAFFNVHTGEKLDLLIPARGGCSSYALTENSVFYRDDSVTQFNFDNNEYSKWDRLRPDCWISTIPSQGLLLSPEAGGGCSCGNWLETSMVFAPKSRAPISFVSTMVSDNNITVTIKPRDKKNKAIYYTIDGSEPTKTSTPYIEPVTLNKETELKAVIYVNKKGNEIPFVRTKTY